MGAHAFVEQTILVPEHVDRTVVFGPADRNVKMVREALGISVSARNGTLILRGEPDQVNKAAAVFETLMRAAIGKRVLDRQQVLDAIVASPDSPVHDVSLEPSELPAWQGGIQIFASGRPIRPKSPNQEAYIEAIRHNDMVFAIGPAGSGKTYLAVAAAVHMLKIGRAKRLILARPAVEAGERLGFLPGDLQQKVNPYLRPLFDALEDMLDYPTLQKMIASDVIEVIPLAFMRGRTLNDSIIILDEAQNTTVNQMLMFLTRMGRRSKCIVTGDVSQIDLEDPRDSGLIDAARRLRGVCGIDFVTLSKRDIVRHSLVQQVVEAYGRTAEEAEAGRLFDRARADAAGGSSGPGRAVSPSADDDADDGVSGDRTDSESTPEAVADVRSRSRDSDGDGN
ncbi:MAG: PhoH family protein [Planctomycetota bacterium]